MRTDALAGEPETGGLDPAEARRRLAQYGPNVLVPERSRSRVWEWLVRAVTDPMTALLLVAGPTYLALGDVTDAAVTLGAIVPIAAVGFALEARAERALEELAHLTAPTAVVRRGGEFVTIAAEEVVPGDVLALREGDVVAADAEVVEGDQLGVDESALTGESYPVAKSSRGEPETRRVLAGTTVSSGRALARVEATGARTEYGKIGTLVAGAGSTVTPLQRLVRGLVVRLGILAAGACLAVAAVERARGGAWGAALIAGVSLAIAAVPEEFPLVYTLYLALGARRLARERALVRRLAGVETLGSTTVICADKTGTLTLGRVEVGAVVVADGTRVLGDSPSTHAERAVLAAAVLASEPEPFDPLDCAIVAHAREHGIDVEALHARELVRDYEFDPGTNSLTHVWRDDDRLLVATKGGVEGVLEVCAASPEVWRVAEDAHSRLAAEGMRVIAVAAGTLVESVDRSRDEEPLRFVGLVAFRDPLRPGVADALRECGDAGVRVVMITGDHPVTAHAVAEGLDLPHEDTAITTGDDVDRIDDEQLRRLVEEAAIFARTRPEQKYRLVRALRADGEVVAMTGDGINDAPALREADIGVAMGERGTAVAREAATMVLLDDNFATIVTAVREGRRIFRNLRTAFAYLIAFHVPLLVGALLVPLLDEPLLLLPIHLILLELIVHPTVALAFERDQPDARLMQSPPRRRGASLLDWGDALGPLALGVTLATAVVVLYLARLDDGATVREARGLALAVLLVGEALLVPVVRARDLPVWRVPGRQNRWLVPLVVATLAMTAAVFEIPALRDLTKVAVLSPGQWVLAAGIAAAATLWMEPIKAVLRWRHPPRRR